MPRKEEYRLYPFGYEDDPDEERFRLSTLDYLTTQTYNNYALFFKVNEEEKSTVAAVLKQGLELSLGQARHLVGTIEKNEYGDDHSFVKKRDSTVGFTVQWLDSPVDNFPSYSDLEKAQFVSSSLGDITVLSVDGMTYGEKPECSPNASPIVSAFQANFIPGGLIFNMHHHHYANDVMGWASFVHQLAENCYSIINNTPGPSWDPACLDHARFTKDAPEEAKVEGPSPPDRHPDHRPSSSLLFHLPKSKAAELKRIASPTDGSWISTYDAFSAFIWRVLSRNRAPVYNPDLASPTVWGEGVNMRRRLNPRAPERIQRNVCYAALSTTAAPTQLTAAEIISEAPLSRLAAYIRKLTDGTTEESLTKALEAVAPIRDKTSLFMRINSLPPMSIAVTDWRDTCIFEADFGFGQPKAYRHLFDTVTEGLIMVYPPRITGDPDEGCELLIACENELIKQVIEDPEMKEYFEFRGFENGEIPR